MKEFPANVQVFRRDAGLRMALQALKDFRQLSENERYSHTWSTKAEACIKRLEFGFKCALILEPTDRLLWTKIDAYSEMVVDRNMNLDDPLLLKLIKH